MVASDRQESDLAAERAAFQAICRRSAAVHEPKDVPRHAREDIADFRRFTTHEDRVDASVVIHGHMHNADYRAAVESADAQAAATVQRLAVRAGMCPLAPLAPRATCPLIDRRGAQAGAEADGRGESRPAPSAIPPEPLSAPAAMSRDELRALLHERGEVDVDELAAVITVNFAGRDFYVGKLLAHGPSPFEGDARNGHSYFARLSSPAGECKLWCLDLKRALSDGQVSVGDDIALAYEGRLPITVPVRRFDAAGNVVGQQTLIAHRPSWTAVKVDRMLACARGQIRELMAG